MAIPAAPAPFITISKSSIFLFSINFIEFIMAAATIIAVPCWSSWKTGILKDFFNLSSISKHIGKASTSANCLNNIALPSITGIDASAPMLPNPSTALPSLTTATRFPLEVYL